MLQKSNMKIVSFLDLWNIISKAKTRKAFHPNTPNANPAAHSPPQIPSRIH